MSCGRQGRAVSMCLLRGDSWFSAQAPESLPWGFIPTEACFRSVHVARKTSSCALDFPLWLCPILPCTAKIPSETNVTVLPTPPLQATAFIGLHISPRTHAAPCPQEPLLAEHTPSTIPERTCQGLLLGASSNGNQAALGLEVHKPSLSSFPPHGQLLLKETLRAPQL